MKKANFAYFRYRVRLMPPWGILSISNFFLYLSIHFRFPAVFLPPSGAADSRSSDNNHSRPDTDHPRKNPADIPGISKRCSFPFPGQLPIRERVSGFQTNCTRRRPRFRKSNTMLFYNTFISSFSRMPDHCPRLIRGQSLVSFRGLRRFAHDRAVSDIRPRFNSLADDGFRHGFLSESVLHGAECRGETRNRIF